MYIDVLWRNYGRNYSIHVPMYIYVPKEKRRLSLSSRLLTSSSQKMKRRERRVSKENTHTHTAKSSESTTCFFLELFTIQRDKRTPEIDRDSGANCRVCDEHWRWTRAQPLSWVTSRGPAMALVEEEEEEQEEQEKRRRRSRWDTFRQRSRKDR